MSQLVAPIISDLRAIGLDLKAVGDGWFALHGDASTSFPEAFLHLTDDDIRKHFDEMADEDVDGAFGSNVDPEKARYSLTLIHLEESLRTGGDAPRYVVVDRGNIRIFHQGDSLPSMPPGDYGWRAAPR